MFNPHPCETFFFSASVTHKSKKKINFSVSWITYHRSLESTPCHGTRRAPARVWRSGNSDMAWIMALCSGTPNSEWSIMRFRRHVRADRGREPGKENGICYESRSDLRHPQGPPRNSIETLKKKLNFHEVCWCNESQRKKYFSTNHNPSLI